MTLDVDYLVVGAGAAGLAFADALVDHGDATVALVDRRAAPGGHWQSAYPFVRLHQASSFYGVASTLLGDGSRQTHGPEQGLHHRATGAEVRAYYEGPVLSRLLATGRVAFLPHTDYQRGRVLVDLEDGTRRSVSARTRIVDAHYLSPATPADSPPPFVVDEGAAVAPVAALPETAASRYAVVGAGKTATDAIVWLLGEGVDPDRITWVRPRDPWMLDRATIQPEPAVFHTFAALTVEAAREAASLDDLFLRLEDAGVMLRIDRSVLPTMAKAPTLGRWELDLLRSVTRVVRQGHVRRAGPSTLELDHARIALDPGTVVVHCAADGLRSRPAVPIWGESITLQPVRAGFPCLGAALAGFVEASGRSDHEKNRVCPSSAYGNSLREWAAMAARGTRASLAFSGEPDIRAWVDTVALNPARIPADAEPSAELDRARARLRESGRPGLEALERLAALPA